MLGNHSAGLFVATFIASPDSAVAKTITTDVMITVINHRRRTLYI
ncbi:hypothetical protein [Actinoplanes derwentensis]|nr:hypothetical protein [Actinoplanes derwentensis]GID88514.1 hypothetical protein Ade03nite_74380 [Actinoplanes derwentensis]